VSKFYNLVFLSYLESWCHLLEELVLGIRAPKLSDINLGHTLSPTHWNGCSDAVCPSDFSHRFQPVWHLAHQLLCYVRHAANTLKLHMSSYLASRFQKVSYISLVRFTPRYLIFFEAIVNGIVFIYSFSVCSLLVYRNANDFYMLILYPATLL
jgi:hypothetical protein